MIEKMNLMTVIGGLNAVDKILKCIINMSVCNPVSAELGLRVLREDYSESDNVPVGILGYDLHTIKASTDLEDLTTELAEIMQRLEIEETSDANLLDDNFSLNDLRSVVKGLKKDLSSMEERLQSIEKEKARLLAFAHIEGLKDVDFDFSQLKDLQNFDVVLGSMDYEYEKRIELNYENINALVLKVGNVKDKALYLFISPKNIKAQIDSILRSVHFKEQEILWEYMDFPAEMQKKLRVDLQALMEEENQLKQQLNQYKTEKSAEIVKAYTHLNLELTLASIKELVYTDDENYILAFWLGNSDLSKVKNELMTEDNSLKIIVYDDSQVKGATVPTKLSNNWLIRPFETLVNMYGTPNYKELDPTGFLAIAYMFLFGAMFGDVGQGFIFVLAGYFMCRKKQEDMIGGVLKRIGLSSMFFGVVYDSIFGVEHLISHFFTETLGLTFLSNLFIRPIENANLMLVLSVIVGIILLIIAYIFGIYNRLKNGDIEEGVFGKNGVNGLLIFLALIAVGVLAYTGADIWIKRILIAVIGVLVLLLLLREPISHKLMGKLPLYSEGVGAYYMESSFELLETFLGMFSNGISFIRVGAFALNHVGLFVAFHTISDMIGTNTGSITMFLVGNIIVIALEGLIVFIQGLRLVYYELFSKFYQGNGEAFVGIKLNSALSSKKER